MTLKTIIREDNKLKNFFAKIYSFTALNIAIFTGLAYLIACNITTFEPIYKLLFGNSIGFLAIPLGMFLILTALSSALLSTNSSNLEISILMSLFLFLEALFFAPFLIIYTSESVITAFALAFGGIFTMGLIGNYTSLDLSQYTHLFFSGILVIGLFEIFCIMCSIHFNIKVTSICVIALILMITAYDVQKIKNIYHQNCDKGISFNKLALLCSIDLFLDFIILVQRILIVLGSKKEK